MIRPPSKTRRGITLLEVLISVFIFLFSIGAIVQLITLCNDQALTAAQQTQAVLLCQTKLEELAAGTLELTSGDWEDLSDDLGDNGPTWQWKRNCDSGEIAGLYDCQVSVQRKLANGMVIEANLSQMIFDPKSRGSTADKAGSSSSSSMGASSGGN